MARRSTLYGLPMDYLEKGRKSGAKREPAKDRKLYECGGCDAYHPQDWNGDCRDDANRIYDLNSEDEVISMEEQLERDSEGHDV